MGFFFFFQAEDGIRDVAVTGVKTCALPIFKHRAGHDRIVSYREFQGYNVGARTRAEQEIARLEFLEELGLARCVGDRSWELSPEHETELRKRQREHDIIKSRSRERQREHGLDRDPEIER